MKKSLLILILLAGFVLAMGEQAKTSDSTEDHTKMNMEETATSNMKMDMKNSHEMKGMMCQ